MKKTLYALIVGLVVLGCLGCSTSEDLPEEPEPSTTTSNVEKTDAFELAAIINDNSDIDVPLLGVVSSTEGGGSSGEGNTEAVPYGNHDGGVKAYAFPYPSDSETVYWTQIYIENDTNHILGIHNGDETSDVQSVMDEYGYAFKESTEHVYTSKDCDHEDIYNNGDVYFYFYMKGNTLVFYLVSVHE